VKAHQQLPSVDVGEHDVQHDDVRHGCFDGLEHILRGVDDAVPGSCRCTPVKVDHIQVVFHDQYGDFTDGRHFCPQEDVVTVYAGFDGYVLRGQYVLDEITFSEAFPCSYRTGCGDLDVPVFKPGVDRYLSSRRVTGQAPYSRDQHLAQHRRVDRCDQIGLHKPRHHSSAVL